MASLSAKLRSVYSDGGGRGIAYGIAYWCPGCDGAHVVYYERPGAGPVWTWDGDVDAPTISPSVLVTYDGADAGEPDAPPSRCHHFVRAGRVEFLADCTHPLAGKTVDLPDFPSNFSTGE